jgi:hypothetical protein
MVPVGECYRSPWGFSPAQGLAALVLGLVGAAGTAGLIWVWEWSGIPTLVVITSLIQGGILGGVLAYLVQRLRLRSTFLAVVLGLFCGLASVALVHLGHYLYYVNIEFGRLIQQDEQLDPAQRDKLYQLYQRNHTKFVDAVLDEQTGHKGLLGYMIARSKEGFEIRGTHWTGWAVIGMWIFEALMVLVPAISLPRSTASTPFCEDCQSWCDTRTGMPQYPSEESETLTEAIRQDNRVALDQLTSKRLIVVEGPATATTLHVCPSCDQTFADVEVQTVGKNKVKTTRLVRRQRISPEMAAALGASKVEPDEVEPDAAQSEDEPEDVAS